MAKLAGSEEETRQIIKSEEFRNIKYTKVLQALFEGPMLTSELMNATQASMYIINKLKDNGHIIVYKERVLEEENQKILRLHPSRWCLTTSRKLFMKKFAG